MLRTVHLHGRLGKRFGKRHVLDVNSPAEAIRALGILRPGFLDHVRKGQYQIRVGDLPLDAGALTLGMGRQRDLHITPAAALAGIETILIVGLAVITAATIAVTLFAMPKPPKAADRERDTKSDSYIFDGPVNSTEQGHPVPLVYGRMRVGSVVASAGIATTDLNAAGVSSDPGHVGYTPGVRGGVYGDEWSDVQLSKGGKGGGGSQRSAQEDPNTLQSQATAKVIDIVSEGEIEGLVDGLKSVFFDETPVQNPDGSFNFAGLSIEERHGLPDQAPMPGFSQTENSYAVDAAIKQSTGPVVRRLLNDDADVCRVTIGLPRLFKQDTTNGDLKQHSVAVAIDYQSANGGFTQVLQHEFRGKNNSPYQRSFDIRLTGPGPHDIRVRRLSPDNELSSIEDDTNLDLLTEIVEAKLIYPDTAMFGLNIDARQFGTSIPTRSYEIKGIIVEVPSNYDPITRVYTGIWDGTFKRAWTDNPAWIYRDIIVNKRYGLGRRIPASAVDKWGLYAIAQHCDQLVPDGQGGQQPRYTLNVCIKSAEAAYDVLASMAGAFRGWVYWGSGAIIAEQDRPEDPSVLIAPANVVDAKISYDRITPLEKRRSVVVIYWNDPDDGYRLTPEIIERPDLIARFGWRPGEELTAFGCTNRAEARRKGLWVFEDEDSGNTSASYQVGDDHAFVTPGRIAEIADPRYSVARRGGRIKASAANSVTIDAPFNIEAGRTYALSVVMPDGTVRKRAVTNAVGQHDLISLGGAAFASMPLVGAVWTIESDLIANRQFRVRAITTDEAPYTVRAVSHDPNKFARVELGRDLPEVNYLAPIDGPLAQPSDIRIAEFLLRDGNSASPAIRMTWAAATDPRVMAYQAQYRRPGDGWTPLADGLDLGRDIRNSEPGVWGFRVRALDNLGRRTAWLEKTQNITAATGALPEIAGLNIATDDIALSAALRWTPPVDVRPLRFEIMRAATNNFAGAASLGETDQSEFPITEPGHYWVRTAFMNERSATPPRIEATATQMPNPQWGRIDDRPLDLADLDPVAAIDLSDAKADIADLITTYGSTASAAASASAAQGYATAAQTAASNAATANTQAQAALSGAQTARDDAIAQAGAAAGSANAAAGSATTATNQANAAAGSALSASGSANVATTKAGEASASATAAASSASSAASSATASGISASAAQVSSVEAGAKNSPALNYNPHFDQAGTFWTQNTTDPILGTIGAFQGRANVLFKTGNLYGYSHLIPVVPGQKYELASSFYVGNAASRHYLGIVPYDANGNSLTPSSGYYYVFAYAQFGAGWQSQSAINDLSVFPTATHIRIFFLFNCDSHPGDYGVDFITFANVTQREAALGSASAAASSASTAAIEATNAAQSASAAQTSATAANTSAGNALTFANQASTSASNAAGSASTASSQANNAANSATAAAGSASAASGSASTAATQATNAANSATAAQASSVSASSSAADAIRTVAASMPGDFGEDGRFFAFFYGDETTAQRVDQAYPNVSYPSTADGRVLRFGSPIAGYLHVTTRKRISTAVARRYRITARVRQNTSAFGPLGAYIAIYGLDASFTTLIYVGHLTTAPSALGHPSGVANLNGAGIQTIGLEFEPVVGGTAAWLVPGFYFFNNTPGDGYNAGQPDVLSMKVEDITESNAAAGSASAAATSASSASTSASQALTQANSATTAANTATAQAGSAQTSASAASGSAASASASASNAASSAASAASSASLSASYYRDTAALNGNYSFDLGMVGWCYSPLGTGELASPDTVGPAWEGNSYFFVQAGRGVSIYTKATISIDPSRKYRMKAKVGAWNSGNPGAAAAIIYAGFVGINGAGAIADHGAYGSYRYACILGAGLAHGQLSEFTSDIITGTGNDSWVKFPPGTTQVRLMAIMNNNATDLNTYLDYLTIEDVTESVASSTSANAASGSAVTAASHAAAALSYAVLSANVSRGAINPNPGFDDYPSGVAGSTPGNWGEYSFGSGAASVSRVADGNGGWSMRVQSGAGNYDSIVQYYYGGLSNMTPSGWYVVEADITLESGTLQGAGIWLDGWNSPDVGYVWGNGLSFPTDPDVTGTAPGNGVAGKRYRYAKLMQVAAGVNVCRLYAMTNYVGGPFGPTNAAKTLVWHYAAIRPATQQEIRDQTVLAPLQATVSTQSGAIATLQGKTVAYLENQVIAGTSRARVSMYAVNEAGNEASQIDLQADTITLGTMANPVLEIVAGAARVNGNLSATSGIALGQTGNLWPIALKPKDYTIADGSVVSFGINLGALPQLDFSTIGLDPLGTGESYDLYADGLSATGFTARLKIKVPGTPSQITLTNDTTPGSGPTRQIDKASNADAQDGNYEFRYQGNVTVENYYEPELGGGIWMAGSAEVNIGIWAKKSGAWQQITTDTLYIEGGTNGATTYQTFDQTNTYQLGSGIEAFGITIGVNWGGSSPALTDFVQVKWTAPGTPSSTRTATPNSRTSKVTVRPQ